ncbi:MAG: 2,3-bisphosphoglycerate-dependent phosphoglycerate mutase [Litorimonas sp.]
MSLCLVRHGKTQWTEEKRFTGWGDARLSEQGLAEAQSAAKALTASGYSFDMCFTSCLERAKLTADIIGEKMGMPTGHIQYDWRLNERHYGALQEKLRSDMVEAHGLSHVTDWRRNFHASPPPLNEDDPRWLEQIDRLPEVPMAQQPKGESMFEATQRTLNFWEDEVEPALKAQKNVLIIAHTNSIRAMVSRLEGFNEVQSGEFRISTAVPRHYELNNELTPVKIRDLTRNPKVILRHWLKRRRMKKLADV